MKMIKNAENRCKIFEKLLAVTFALVLFCSTFLGTYSLLLPKSVSCFIGEDVPSYLGATVELDGEEIGSLANLTRGQYKLFGAIPVGNVNVAKLEDVKVYVGGVPFGIKFFTRGASIVGFDDEQSNPAYLAGLRLYDTIIKINGKDISSSSDVLREIERGGEVEVTYLRAGKEAHVKFVPKYSNSENKYSLGIWLKDSGAGIGTVTFVLPDGSFAGLGHGICEGNTGELTSIVGGSVLDVTINGVEKGQKGTPGELKGYFNSSKIGALWKNSEVGVFGALVNVPESIKGTTYSLGLRDELKEGSATLLCTLDDNVRREYSIEISKINRNATGNKCFTVKIVDEKLIDATGGIVQGMSGSPIIQNGKLVGALTHVLVNDPTLGYGIFVENMLLQMSAQQQAAA